MNLFEQEISTYFNRSKRDSDYFIERSSHHHKDTLETQPQSSELPSSTRAPTQTVNCELKSQLVFPKVKREEEPSSISTKRDDKFAISKMIEGLKQLRRLSKDGLMMLTPRTDKLQQQGQFMQSRSTRATDNEGQSAQGEDNSKPVLKLPANKIGKRQNAGSKPAASCKPSHHIQSLLELSRKIRPSPLPTSLTTLPSN